MDKNSSLGFSYLENQDDGNNTKKPSIMNRFLTRMAVHENGFSNPNQKQNNGKIPEQMMTFMAAHENGYFNPNRILNSKTSEQMMTNNTGSNNTNQYSKRFGRFFTQTNTNTNTSPVTNSNTNTNTSNKSNKSSGLMLTRMAVYENGFKN